MNEMREKYKDTFIYKVCDELGVNIKELALLMGKGSKCIENWRKDEDSIPAKEMQLMKLLIRNKKLEDEIINLQKHRVIHHDAFTSSLDGSMFLETSVVGLKVIGTLQEDKHLLGGTDGKD